MIILPATIEGVTTRKDRTWKVTLGTQELPVDKAAALLTLNHQLAYVAIKPEYFSGEEEQLLEQLKADPEAGGKTPGSRLRAVLYRNYEQNDQGFGSFASYYEHHMERLIEHFKGKLT
jgi:hypothetical protein